MSKTQTVDYKDELLKQIYEITEKSKKGVFTAIEKISQETPELIKDIVRWQIILGIVEVLSGLIVLLVAFLCMTKVVFDSGVGILFFILTCFLLVVGAMVVFTVLPSMLKPIFAKRLFIVEYIANIAKGK